MEEITIPVRFQTVFQTDNGMRVEKWSKVSEIKKPSENDEQNDYRPEKDLYVGVVHVLTEEGPREIKFEIKANTIEEAFGNYVPFARAAVEAHQNNMQEMINKHQRELINKNQRELIVTAPAEALDIIDKKYEQQKTNSSLIIS